MDTDSRSTSASIPISLIERWKQGDMSAANKILGRLRYTAHKYALEIICDKARDTYGAADDIIQTANIEVVNKISELHNNSQFKTWYFHLIKYRALDYLSSISALGSSPDTRWRPRFKYLSGMAAKGVNVIDQRPIATHVLKQQYTREQILELAKSHLSEPVFRTFMLRYYSNGSKNLSYKHVGEIQGITVDGVKKKPRNREKSSEIQYPFTRSGAPLC